MFHIHDNMDIAHISPEIDQSSLSTFNYHIAVSNTNRMIIRSDKRTIIELLVCALSSSFGIVMF